MSERKITVEPVTLLQAIVVNMIFTTLLWIVLETVEQHRQPGCWWSHKTVQVRRGSVDVLGYDDPLLLTVDQCTSCNERTAGMYVFVRSLVNMISRPERQDVDVTWAEAVLDAAEEKLSDESE